MARRSSPTAPAARSSRLIARPKPSSRRRSTSTCCASSARPGASSGTADPTSTVRSSRSTGAPTADSMTGSAERLALRAESLRGPVACVDLETTGGLAAHHRVIEVGIVLLDDGDVVEEWSTLVQPGLRIPPSIASFTGIDDWMVADAPRFEDVAQEVRRRLDGRLFVAHNA